MMLSACASDGGVVSAAMPFLKCQDKTTPPKLSDEIVGGQTVGYADPDQKVVVLLKIHHAGHDSICTGSLIRDRVILTAAHCVSGVEASDVSAFFVTEEGCPIDRQQLVVRTGKEIAIEKGFDGSPQSYSDVALIKIQQDAPKDQQRLKLVKAADEFTDELTLLGYGITDEVRKDAETLRRVYKPKSEISIREKIVVIDQRKGTGFCRGDSGAPLLASVWTEPKILAVNSATVGTATNNECHTLSVAMNVRYFDNWIETTADQMSYRSWFRKIADAVGL